MNNNFETRIIDLVNKINELPEQDKKNIIEFAENNELGLALDSLAHQVYEYDIKITHEIFEEISKIGASTGINQAEWNFLKKL